ncbi:MAG: F0F1 ATP synthase subunit epsilon [Flammeovirgaceae bacterium]
MHLEIITPDVKAFEGEVSAVKVPGTDGTFEMLDKHANIISTLINGEVRVKTASNETKTFDIEGGVVEMLDNKVVILAEAIKAGLAES